MRKWDAVDGTAQFLLQQRLLDTTVLTIDQHPTTVLQWTELSQYFTKKSAYAKNDLETTFREMKCQKGGDVRAFLANVRFKREELRIAGVTVTAAEYECTVLKGIPPELASFASGLLPGPNPRPLEMMLSQLRGPRARRNAARATATTVARRGIGRGSADLRRRRNRLRIMPKPGKLTRHRSLKRSLLGRRMLSRLRTRLRTSAGQLNSLREHQTLATISLTRLTGYVRRRRPPQLSSHLFQAMAANASSYMTRAPLVTSPLTNPTSHRTPHLDPPVYLNAANQQRFPAIGTGTLSIRAPNGAASSILTLHECSPCTGRWVHVGIHWRIGQAGLPHLYWWRDSRAVLTERRARRAHPTDHPGPVSHHTCEESANSVETVSIMELHRRMGHIAPASARTLVEKGLVTGIRLDPDSREADCEACLFARATRKPSRKSASALERKVLATRCTATCGGRRPSLLSVGVDTLSPLRMMLPATRSHTSCIKAEAFGSYKAFEAWALAQQLAPRSKSFDRTVVGSTSAALSIST
jgi:hypothetical protein